jgi:hypothetical protein
MPMPRTKIGSAKTAASQNRRVISTNSGLGASKSSIVNRAGFNSRAMPHFEQIPGTSCSSPGHIGQKYLAVTELGSTASVLPPAQCGQGVEAIGNKNADPAGLTEASD